MATKFDRPINRGPFRPLAQPVRDPAQEAWAMHVDRAISARALTQAEKNRLWRLMKSDHPELVEFFASPLVKELIAAGATPAFPPALISAIRNATNR